MTPLDFNCFINASDEKDLHEKIRTLIHKIKPKWDSNHLKLNKFTNGITNTVLSVEDSSKNDEKLIFRIYGNGTENIIDRKNELESFELLHKFSIAPKVFAKFYNGFVVGHLPGEVLTTSTVRDPSIIRRFCEKLAKMHKIPVKVSPKEEAFLFTKSRQFLDNIPEKFDCSKKQRLFEKYFADVDFNSILNEVKSMIESAKQTNQVLSHNDLLINNILYDSDQDECHIIDYEYTNVNYQMFDIANHFNEFAGIDDVNYDLCPNENEKRDFLKTYLKFYLENEPTNDEIEQMLAEIPIFEAASHAFWIFWAVFQANNSTIDFDYLDYARQRLDQYFKITKDIKRRNHL